MLKEQKGKDKDLHRLPTQHSQKARPWHIRRAVVDEQWASMGLPWVFVCHKGPRAHGHACRSQCM